MKPAPFTYIAPDSISATLQAKALHGAEAQFLAGGQSLVPSLSFRCLRPSYLIDLNGIGDLDYVRLDDSGMIRIGGMTRYHTLEHSELIQKHVPMMHDAIPYIAHDAIRSRGTIGGSLSYADPAAELPTVTMALGARYLLRSVSGERWVAATDFFAGMFKTVLGPEELLVEVEIPAVTEADTWGFIERSRRHGDRVLMGVAAWLSLTADRRCSAARLVYQNGAAVPLLAKQASALLYSDVLTTERVIAVAKLAAYEEIDPESDVHATSEFRRHLAFELTQRALGDAVRRAGIVLESEGGTR